jgi:hypothetical protein
MEREVVLIVEVLPSDFPGAPERDVDLLFKPGKFNSGVQKNPEFTSCSVAPRLLFI